MWNFPPPVTSADLEKMQIYIDGEWVKATHKIKMYIDGEWVSAYEYLKEREYEEHRTLV